MAESELLHHEHPIQSDARPEMECEHVSTESGVWRVYKKDDQVIIVDDMGRMRHMSRGHALTAVYLAMEMSRSEFHSSDLNDKYLRSSAEHFTGEKFGGW